MHELSQKKSTVIIGDEPTGNLDSENAENVFKILTSHKKGRHIIIVSHDIEKAKAYADRIITLSDGKVLSDIKNEQVQTDDYKACNENKSALTNTDNTRAFLKATGIIGINSIKKRTGKILSIILVLSIAVSAMSIALGISSIGNSVSDRVNKYYLENDLISLYYPASYYMSVGDTVIEEEQINRINSEFSATATVQKYYFSTDSFLFGLGEDFTEAEIKIISISSFFEERISHNEITGTFPGNCFETIISSDIASRFFPDGAIGKMITLHDGEGHSVELQVSGINHSANPFDSIYSFVCDDALKNLFEQKLQDDLNKKMIISPYKENSTESASRNRSMKAYVKSVEECDNIHLLFGNMPSSENQILISSKEAILLLGEKWNDNVNSVLNEEYYINNNGVFIVSISGIFESDELVILSSREIISELAVAEPVAVDLYLPDSADLDSVCTQIESQYGMQIEKTFDNLKAEINSQTSFFRIAMIVFCALFSILAISMLNSFSKISVLERKREIAIIKSLGASNLWVIMALLFDVLTISISAIAVSFGLTYIAYRYLPNLFSQINNLNLSFPFSEQTIVSLIFEILMICCFGIHYSGIALKMPADLLQE